MGAERLQRLVFGEDAEQYHRARPSYPAELVDDVVALAGLPCRAVDAGCGTGKAAALLAERGVAGVGVEPDPAMATVARRTLAPFPGWRVEQSDFEDWEPPAGETFDLVTCAQAWHWIDRERGTSRAARLLRPGGVAAIFWRRPVEVDTPVRRELDAAYAELAPEMPASRGGGEQPLAAGAGFEEPVLRRYEGTQAYAAAEWVELLRTSSDHRLLDPERRERLLEAVAAAIERHGGTYEHRFACELWIARRR